MGHHRSIHEITRREISSLVFQVAAQRTPNSAHRLLKGIKRFFSWCLGRAILESSPALGIQSGYREVSRDRVLGDEELARVIKAAREIGGPFGGVVEFLALTGQRREEANQMTRDELDLDHRIWTLPASRAKNGRRHIVHLSEEAVTVLTQPHRGQTYIFSNTPRPYQRFNRSKRRLDAMSGVQDWVLHDLRRTCVSGMARIGVAPHVADKILNHQSGTISGVAAVYQRHEFLAERKDALERWGAHVSALGKGRRIEGRERQPSYDEVRKISCTREKRSDDPAACKA
jgi:integrase